MCEHAWKFAGDYSSGMESEVAAPEGCAAPVVLGCVHCGLVVALRCHTTRSKKCQPCGKAYRQRVGHVAASGIRRLDVLADGLFVTITAPGDERHRVVRFEGDTWGPWCECTPRPTDYATWNASCPERWRMVIQWLRRELGEDVEYFRATETQERGALHFHVILRRRDGGALHLSVPELRRVLIRNGFGHDCDVKALDDEGLDAAGYVAKYVAKSADDRGDVPWKGWRRRERVVKDDDGNVVGVKKWRERSSKATYRTWVASRQFGDSMRLIRAAQAHYTDVVTRLPRWVDDGGRSLPYWRYLSEEFMDSMRPRPDVLQLA